MDTMEGFLTVQTSHKEKSLYHEIYVKLTYDPNVHDNVHIKRMTDARTIYILVLREVTFVVVGV